ncbi:hypothetical protein JKF63_01957 [Porcisia hertigi]|uniref:Mitochondrial import inner membrane translocase subunit TIM50 n=1 Tax=Porcisia hertigi TaxID=2761500 RepID=A0A836L1U5_9TRYP|nr:hypothetical protein JKF63_01957 [Porcisia hertigi]
MSFSRPKRPLQRMLPRSSSNSVLTDRHRARQSRNRFQRRPLRTSHSTQSLLPRSVDSGGNGEGVSTSYSVTTHSTARYMNLESVSDTASEYSEYDLVNEQMQHFLLDSEDTSDSDADVDGLLSSAAVFMGEFTPTRMGEAHRSRSWKRTKMPVRRRVAKKSESCASLSSAPRITPSASHTLLSDLDTAVREAVTMGGASQRCRTRKQPRPTSGRERRWLVPPLPSVSVEAAHAGEGVSMQWPWFTIVFDLDETLVSARYGPIHLRPHVGELLRSLHRLPVEIIVWTAGTAHYVNPILQSIGHACGRRQWFHHVISRHKRWYRDTNTSVKDLSQLGRPLDRLVMVENNPVSALPQPSMCVLLEDYLGPNPADESLLVLRELFERLVVRYARGLSTAPPTGICEEATEDFPSAQRIATSSSTTLRDLTTVVNATTFLSAPLAVLIREDAALQFVEFQIEDVVKEKGVSMLQRVEMRECVGGADRLRCLGLRYRPPPLAPPTLVAPPGGAASVTSSLLSLRSYGSINPLHPL